MICLTLVLPFSLKAQRLYGNEWIQPDQVYFRIPVFKTGLYKISTQELGQYGIPIHEIPAASLQMFRRGKELAIETTTDYSGKLGNDGYLIFFGEKNDGAADSLLYTSRAAMPHSYYSLYSDTAAYFLTWKMDGQAGKRIPVNEPGMQQDTVGYHFEEAFQLFNSHYLPGPFYPPGSNFENGSVLTAYDTGEGWTGPELKENLSFEMSVQTQSVNINHFEKARIEILLAGWSPGRHLFELWTGSIAKPLRKLADIDFVDYNTPVVKAELRPSDVEKDSKVNFTLIPIDKGGHISVSYLKLRYPQKSSIENDLTQKTYYFNVGKRSFWKIKNDGSVQFYDCSDPLNAKKLSYNESGIEINGAAKVLAVREAMNVHSCQPVQFRNIDSLSVDYLMITHPPMRLSVQGSDPVADYASYRASTAGGGYKPLVIHSSEVYNAFNYGDPGPQGIKNMIAWLHQKGNLKFVFLIGRSIDPQKARKLADAAQVDMVPNAGWPGSDIALAMNTNPDSTEWPTVPIGRVNAENAQQVHDYLQKVKAMEAEPSYSPWRKNILHLSGGRSRDELALFKSYINSFEQKLQNTPLAASVKTISKETDDPVEKLPVYEPVNKGVALMTLFGHSGLDVTDIDIGLASDPVSRYQNHPYYPAVIVNGCASGSIFYSTKTLSSDWIFAPKSGAVLFLAHTFNGVSTSLKRYTHIFYEVLADSAFTSAPFGSIQQEAIRRNMLRDPDILDKITVQQMTLHGDPAIRIFPAPLPDADAIDSSVIADNIPPILIVTIDKRQITDHECVSDRPTLGIELIDSNIAETKSDTSGITVWMKKKCQGCGEKRIYLRNASCKNLSPGHSYLELTLPEPLEIGSYHLTVQARDQDRNFAPDYEINFRVSASNSVTNVTVSPNPSGEWFRFALDFEGLNISRNMTLTIHDSYGRKVKESVFKPHIGKNEWYWIPEQLPAGLYFYSLQPDPNSHNQSSQTTKVMKGKLIRTK
ncbi:C25 family cysteine peptidase [Dyadobacter pollutisoli]|uniref:C25 family cysteine peptidase n=1 Tax=Dyadobacter pollutisoli TaxID=2910158 RepID=A0A9E8N912_9BACT|nr:C25 family cysteine peptidase [Dyadobacter pollutisoli]WAC11558.1 C25 family cysteine peptidase [Dyadobacter pollutisoli]